MPSPIGRAAAIHFHRGRKMSGNYRRSPAIALVALLIVTGVARVLAAEKPPAGPKIVMIIRHGEKPQGPEAKKNPNLSERGRERARALAKVIPEHFPKPEILIATKPTKESDRPVETITPLAEALHEKIHDHFADDQYEQLAKAVLTEPKYVGKVVLIAWHHGKIPHLAKALGAKQAPHEWNENVFDRVWEIRYENGTTTFQDLPEHALPGDSNP